MSPFSPPRRLILAGLTLGVVASAGLVAQSRLQADMLSGVGGCVVTMPVSPEARTFSRDIRFQAREARTSTVFSVPIVGSWCTVTVGGTTIEPGSIQNVMDGQYNVVRDNDGNVIIGANGTPASRSIQVSIEGFSMNTIIPTWWTNYYQLWYQPPAVAPPPAVEPPLVVPAAESLTDSFGGCRVVASRPNGGTFQNSVVITTQAEANTVCDITVEETLITEPLQPVLGGNFSVLRDASGIAIRP
ncbi:MAG: hypothetical protein HOO67_04825, partial [Candidatus Peribacteraceae bacterium]|nr:hypothetical protein [Candidatus Peribacteraceae bacterium]